jgi:hypothetical protein
MSVPTVAANDAILDYLGRGWSIIPIRPGDKRPLVRWEEFQHRRANEAEVRGWFRTWPDAGIGVVTGAISDLVVIDVDLRHGGEVGLEELEREHGQLPTTVECRTGGGGRHLYFVHPGGVIHNKVGLASGVDLQGRLWTSREARLSGVLRGSPARTVQVPCYSACSGTAHGPSSRCARSVSFSLRSSRWPCT